MPTIMIVDDQELNRRALARLLERSDRRVIEANDGTTALELARTERPDLAVVDLLMPEMDGFEFAHRLRSEGGPLARMPIIFMSALFLPDEVIELAHLCGVEHLLSRDADTAEIRETVERALRGPRLSVTVPPWREFTLRLLQFHTNAVSNQLKAVIPALAGIRNGSCVGCECSGGGCPGAA